MTTDAAALVPLPLRHQAVTPVGFFVLPRSKLPIVLQEDVQNLKRGDPIWKQRARLP